MARSRINDPIDMRLIQDTHGWRALDSAPADEDVTLLVIDGASEPYQLKAPFRLTAARAGVSSAKGTPPAVTPLKWKPYNPPRPPPKKAEARQISGATP
jgi:hypothetical protein